MMGVLNAIGQVIYEEGAGKKDRRMQFFGLIDAWSFFIEKVREFPMARYCVLHIERKGDHYEIMQVLANSDKKQIMISGDFAAGRSVQAYNLNQDIQEYMGEDKLVWMDISVLKRRER